MKWKIIKFSLLPIYVSTLHKVWDTHRQTRRTSRSQSSSSTRHTLEQAQCMKWNMCILLFCIICMVWIDSCMLSLFPAFGSCLYHTRKFCGYRNITYIFSFGTRWSLRSRHSSVSLFSLLTWRSNQTNHTWMSLLTLRTRVTSQTCQT